MGEESSITIADVKLGECRLYQNCVGDTWDPAWAADDNLYFPGNDGSGWDSSCSSNVFFSRAVGDNYLSLNGQTINGMSEYDGWAKQGPDGRTWKSSGCISMDGILYFAVARHTYGTKSGDPFVRQTASGANIIKSTDGGLTWARTARENYEHPMFPGSRFATPYFIHYGRDGEAPRVDRADEYVYAISNNGFWCNGDNYILGRVARSRMGRLDPSDWEFYTGGDEMQDVSWSQEMDRAAPIIENPLRCGETGATYIPSIGRYVLVAWYYPGDPNVETDETRLIFYQAPHPWGPWSAVKEEVSRPEGWYCPRVLAKWQKRIGNEVEAVLATGGDYYEMAKYYRFTLVPVKLKLDGKYPALDPGPAPLVVVHSNIGEGPNQFQYQGVWECSQAREKAMGGGEHYSAQTDACFALTFNGSRLKWYASKENNMGIAAVSMDGGEEILVDLYTYCVVPQYGRLLYDSGTLEKGTHAFRVRVTGQKSEQSSGVYVFNDRVEIIA
jgi:hypothetical protein